MINLNWWPAGLGMAMLALLQAGYAYAASYDPGASSSGDVRTAFPFSEHLLHSGQFERFPAGARRAVLRALAYPDRDARLRQLIPNRTKLVGGELWFDLSGIEVRPDDLQSSSNLTRICWDYATFVGPMDLRGLNFHPSLMRGVHFKNVDLSAARLATDLNCATFFGGRLERAQLEGCDLGTHAAFADGVVLDGALLNNVRAEPGLKFMNASMRGTKLRDSQLEAAEFVSTDLSGSDLTGATLRSTVWLDCDLHGATLVDVDLRRSRFSRIVAFEGVRLLRTNLTESLLGDLDLSRMNVEALTWDEGRHVIGEEEEGDHLAERGDPMFRREQKELYAKAVAHYRRLAEAYQRAGYSEEYRALRFRGFESRRKWLAVNNDGRRKLEWLRLTAERSIDAYGTSLGQLACFTGWTIAGFTLIHALLWGVGWSRRRRWVIFVPAAKAAAAREGAVVEDSWDLGTFVGQCAWPARITWLAVLFEALLLSVTTTFAVLERVVNTPGILGLLLPKRRVAEPQGVGRVVAGAQALVGVVVVYALVRVVASSVVGA